MENFFPEHLLELLFISLTFSTVLMLLIQKFKRLSFVTKSWQVWFINLFASFGIGVPFSITFYNTSLEDGVWVGLFSFVGATGIYNALKKQNLINYTPTSVSDNITLPKAKEIKR